MMNTKVKDQALELSAKERARLAHILIESLHDENEIRSEDEWSEELKKRIDRFERGESTSKAWYEVKERAYLNLTTQ